MAISVVAVTYFSTRTRNISSTVDEYDVPLATASGSDRALIFLSNRRGGTVATITGLTVNGVAGTVWRNSGVDGGNASGSSVMYSIDSQLPSSAGTYVLSTTCSMSTSSARPIVCYELTGVDQTTPLSDWVVNLLTAVAATDTVSVTLPSALGKFAIGYVAASSTSNFAFSNATPPSQSDGSNLPAVGDGVFSSRLMSMRDVAVATASEQYDWILNAGASIDSMVVAAFVVNAAAGGGAVARAQGLQNLSAQFAAVSATRLGGVLQ